MTLSRYFGQHLVRLRHEAGMSQEKLAERAGLSRTYIGFLETGRQSPSLETVLRLKDALGVSLTGLVEERPEGWREKSAARGKGRGEQQLKLRRLQQLCHLVEKFSLREVEVIEAVVRSLLKLRKKKS